MREVNFSIPNVNKASVGITTALYDRRALDCTSTLPLINSLNHLAYLTTSSARIRDILTVDGGVERLVCILKQGRSTEMMEMWKWNLAFTCVVNIGVRGSETVRTRVVEADMVPVIATILDNYIKVIDKHREKMESEVRRASSRCSLTKPVTRPRDYSGRPTFHDRGHNSTDHRAFRRQAPPPAIEIPQSFAQQQRDPSTMDVTPTPPQLAVTSPHDRSPFNSHRHHHHHHHHHHHRNQEPRSAYTIPGPANRLPAFQPHISAPSRENQEGFGLRAVRDVDRLPSMIPALQTGITSQPESPTTPNAPITRPLVVPRDRRRPSLRQQFSNSGDSDDLPEVPLETSLPVDQNDDSMVDIETALDLQGPGGPEPMLDAVATPITFDGQTGSEGQEAETFNITHRSMFDGSILTTNIPTPGNTTGLPTGPPPTTIINVPPMPQPNAHERYFLDRTAPPGILAATPRDEDVLMSLQLLAYVSKYCNLRVYFQKSHLVPKLKIGNSIHTLGEVSPPKTNSDQNDDEDEEYLLPDDFNIFPLVEKFTVRHHSQDMQYWAGVVMRNLCRKDDSRGGIRQCAYYECGKWEQKTRQFAKCRRCRRTKYCSKDCQKNAWIYHRHWCQVPTQ